MIQKIMEQADIKAMLVPVWVKPSILKKEIKVFDKEVDADSITSGSKSIKDGR